MLLDKKSVVVGTCMNLPCNKRGGSSSARQQFNGLGSDKVLSRRRSWERQSLPEGTEGRANLPPVLTLDSWSRYYAQIPHSEQSYSLQCGDSGFLFRHTSVRHSWQHCVRTMFTTIFKWKLQDVSFFFLSCDRGQLIIAFFCYVGSTELVISICQRRWSLVSFDKADSGSKLAHGWCFEFSCV
jgi:hypothetical protein